MPSFSNAVVHVLFLLTTTMDEAGKLTITSTKCKTKHTRRHRGGTRKKCGAPGARASITRTRRHAVSVNKQAGKRTDKGKVRAGRCTERAHRKFMECKHPGKALDVLIQLSLAITCHQRNATHNSGVIWPSRAHWGIM